MPGEQFRGGDLVPVPFLQEDKVGVPADLQIALAREAKRWATLSEVRRAKRSAGSLRRRTASSKSSG